MTSLSSIVAKFPGTMAGAAQAAAFVAAVIVVAHVVTGVQASGR